MRRGHQVVMGVAAAVALVGCGSSGGGGNGSASSPKAASKPAATPATKGGPVDAAIKDFDYVPGRIEVKPGTKVTWTNRDASNHTVTFDTGAQKDLGNQGQGQSRSFTFRKAGTYAYHCDYHPNMHGTVVVR